MQKIELTKNQRILVGILCWLMFFVPALVVFPSLRPFLGFYMGVGILFGLARSYFLFELEKKIYLVHSMLIKYIKNEKIREEYSEDTRNWLERSIKARQVTRKSGTIFFLSMIPLAIFFMGEEVHLWLLLANINEGFAILFGFNWWASIFLCVAFAWLLCWVLFLIKNYFFTTNVIHHYSFWEYVPKFTTESKERNYLGELFFLNLFLWALAMVVFVNIQFGIALGMSGWIFTPVNPKHNYYAGMKKTYKILAWAFMGLLGIGLFLCIFRNMQDSNFFFYTLINTILVIFFIGTIIRLFILGNPGFEIQKSVPVWLRFCARLNIDPHNFILIVAMIPLALAALNVYLFETQLHYLASLWVGLVFLTVGFILINFKVLTLVENTKQIALNFQDKIKPHKLDEHRFHFWETFSSPIATLFALTIGGLFFLILNSVFLKFNFEPVSFWGFLPTFLVVVLNGAALGALIWHTENGIHYIWHCFAIREDFKFPTPPEFYAPIREFYEEPARKVRNAMMDIFGIYVPIGQIGLSLLLGQSIYEMIILVIIYVLLFPRIIKFAFKKMVPLPD